MTGLQFSTFRIRVFSFLSSESLQVRTELQTKHLISPISCIYILVDQKLYFLPVLYDWENDFIVISGEQANLRVSLKGLGHAILGNFSTDQMVIELTKISQKRLKTIEDLK